MRVRNGITGMNPGFAGHKKGKGTAWQRLVELKSLAVTWRGSRCPKDGERVNGLRGGQRED